ncbi:hypothetical protein D1872_322010 [compost metagenome]
MTPCRRNRKPRVSFNVVYVVAQIEELAMNRRNISEIVVRCSIFAVTYDIILVLRVARVRKIFVCKICDIVFRSIDPPETS